MNIFKAVASVDRLGLLCVVATVTGVALTASPVCAAGTPGPTWAVKSVATPTTFSAEDNTSCEKGEENCDAYEVTVTNVGTRASSGTVIVRDRLPNGIRLREGSTAAETLGEDTGEYLPGEIAARGALECPVREPSLVKCEFNGSVPPQGVIVLQPQVVVVGAARSAVSNRVEVEELGGTAASVTSAAPESVANMVNGPEAVFGVQDFAAGVLGVEGASDVQAGDHPATITTSLDWNTVHNNKAAPHTAFAFLAAADPRTQIVDLPTGLVGDPLALEECALSAVYGTRLHPGKCPVDSRVGVIEVPNDGKPELYFVYNVVPEVGYPAEFAFEALHTMIVLRPRLLPSAGGYVLSVSVPLVPRAEEIKPSAARVTFWGNPGEFNGRVGGEAFLTNPDDCAAGPLSSRLEMDSWVQPEDWQSAEAPMFAASGSQGVSGCDALRFAPSIAVTPETSEVDTPSGLEVDLRVPQASNVPGDLATPDLKDAVLSLPEGVSVSPGAANGLQACQEAGAEGIELGAGDVLASENKVQEGEEMGGDGLVHAALGHCPAGSQIGDVEVISPLLEEHLKGHVFVAEPGCGGAGQGECTPASAEDGELFGIYLEVGSEASGIHVKLKGRVSVNPQTGRVTTRFDENPQLPFSELKLRLNGGPRAPLANPQSCAGFPLGPEGLPLAVTTSDLAPWSTPYTPDATPSSSFGVTGCAGGGFAPGFSAGTVSPAAGVFSPFTLTFSRHDGEQDLSGLTVNMPQGLLGRIAGVAQCPEAAANAGTCGAVSPGSRIGTAKAAAGAGAAPFWQSGGVYLTGPYNGGPFGLSVVVPADAGPYHLGNVVTRAAIHINPTTSAVTVVSNPLPQMIDGVPLRLQTVNVTVGGEGSGFTFNSTNCAATAVGAAISGSQGASAKVSSPYQATGCTKLAAFKPVFSASTRAKTSKLDGASLDVRIAAHQGPTQPAGAEEANIAKVDTALPIALPSRLTTLQKACTEKQFAANPAGCPPGSAVGTAVAHTPLLPVPLEGPAYLVSHGGAAFPDLVLLLQGDGVAIELTGLTDIKKGITYSKFEAAPDAPFESFELKLPEGPDSILGVDTQAVKNASLCQPIKTTTITKKITKRIHGHNKKVTVKVKESIPTSLVMPTTITAQDGATLTQQTKITTTGCPKPATKAKNAKKNKKK